MNTQIIANNPLIRVKNCSSSSTNSILRCFSGISLQQLSRFYTVRRAYSRLQQILQYGDRQLARVQQEPSLFDGFSVENAVQQMQEQSVAFGLQLPSEMTHVIHEYALNNPCFEPERSGQFKIGDITNGYLNGHPVFRALVADLTDCQPIQQLTKDPILLQIASRYLGYYPTLITQHLTFSIASNLPTAEIQKNYPPASFHYDIAGYNFVTCYFYITQVDLDSGPHVMIANSHRHKPLSLLLRSGRFSDETIDRYYQRHRDRHPEIAIVGQPGYGFFQDPSCVHKVVAPIAQHRLLLQFRYS
ncbi:hypothetical protein [Roseofilum casamattae]|uniref:Phytanoyl-CoA dioxygenase n=1 Tax=Roseofilum casamattae BLCC-M143 TaxID=3022442 RepID=A0ABT7BTP6_9CYAN|nr:hypothetical protein [Roseofilum casamattae]MDJ1181866.1 hypothetical protein [Roseofilum casamattae BLCC-M143]